MEELFSSSLFTSGIVQR